MVTRGWQICLTTIGGNFLVALRLCQQRLKRTKEGTIPGPELRTTVRLNCFGTDANTAGRYGRKPRRSIQTTCSGRGPQCSLAAETNGMNRLGAASYRWLRAQMSLEQSNCADLVGDLGTYEAAIDEGLQAKQRVTSSYSLLFCAVGVSGALCMLRSETPADFAGVRKD